MPAISFSRKPQMPLLLAAMPVLASLGGCHEHFAPPHQVVQGRPVNVFANPVGYAYPEITNRMRSAGYRPLPVPTQRPLGSNLSSVTPVAPKSTRKQTTVVPAPAAPVAATKPTVEIVPRQDEVEGRSTTQMRR